VIPHLVDYGLSILQYADDTFSLWNMRKSKKVEVNFVMFGATIGPKD
jgi:hypothetical protein